MKKQEPKFKTYRAECKAGEEPGVIDAFIPMSVGTVDRDEELIVPTAYEKTIPIFMKRPVLVSSHAYSDLRKQIGEFKEIKIKGKGVFAKPKYYVDEGNEEADWGYNLALHNMAAYSVGFIPKKWTDGKSEKEPRRTYTEVELLEISQVVVPSNRDAIQGLRSKAVGVEAALLDEVLESDLIEKKPEETDLYIRIPVSEGHDDHKMRTITVSKDDQITALYCIQDKVIVTYLFSTDVWDMESAREWVKDHEKAFVVEVEPEVSPIVTSGNVQWQVGDDYATANTATCTTTDAKDGTCTIHLNPLTPAETEPVTIKAVTEADIADDLDEIVTWFEQGGTLTKDNYSYAWRVINALMNNAGPNPDDIQPIDIVTAARVAVMEILGGK